MHSAANFTQAAAIDLPARAIFSLWLRVHMQSLQDVVQCRCNMSSWQQTAAGRCPVLTQWKAFEDQRRQTLLRCLQDGVQCCEQQPGQRRSAAGLAVLGVEPDRPDARHPRGGDWRHSLEVSQVKMAGALVCLFRGIVCHVALSARLAVRHSSSSKVTSEDSNVVAGPVVGPVVGFCTDSHSGVSSCLGSKPTSSPTVNHFFVCRCSLVSQNALQLKAQSANAGPVAGCTPIGAAAAVVTPAPTAATPAPTTALVAAPVTEAPTMAPVAPAPAAVPVVTAAPTAAVVPLLPVAPVAAPAVPAAEPATEAPTALLVRAQHTTRSGAVPS